MIPRSRQRPRGLFQAVAWASRLTAGVVMGLLLAWLSLSASTPAQAQPAGASFDHVATAFPLVGAHEQVRCETCHLKGIFKTTPTACADCHVQNNARGAVAKPLNHIQTTDTCDSCHSVATFSGGRYSHVTAAPGGCASCHNGARAKGKSPNHSPTNGLSCDACHGTNAFLPVRKYDHSLLAGDYSTCANCHDGHIATGRPANHIATPNPTQCASCHVASTETLFRSFAGGQMDHTGITSGCATCHGPSVAGGIFAGITSIVVMPPTSPAGAGAHIPSSTTCETCHLANVPGGLVPANATVKAPGTQFALPLPTGPQIHSGVTSGCSSCHDTGAVWMGMDQYPISPATLAGATSATQFKGFQTRPNATARTFAVADPAHPQSGDCAQCHYSTSAFTTQDKPGNHIPFAATAQCNSCHTSTDFSVMPTLAAIHANAPSTSSNCAQCHGSAAASLAIPAANFSVVGLPGNHVPTTASCETCHVGPGSSIAATPVGNGAKFSGSLMNHTGITNNCASCHGPSVTGASFAGISKIVVMPPTSPMGTGSHIPSSTTCETCHLGSLPASPVPANASKSAPGTAFATPAPTGVQIHTGVTSGCASCHDTGYQWMGVSNALYAISPSTLTAGAQYKGFQTRPKPSAGTFNVADAAHPTAGDCSQCHSSTTAFTATDRPANHIPFAASAQCNSCHTSTTDFSIAPTLTAIHANAPSTSSNCGQCHGAAAASFAIPGANFSIVGLPGNHLPSTQSCELCHVGAGSSIAATPVVNGAKFSGSKFSHSGITSNCAACHGPSVTGTSFAGVSKIIVMPATTPVGSSSHIPSSTTCEACHLGSTPAGMIAANATANTPGSGFATPVPTGVQIHTGVTGGCSSCHDTGYQWMGVSVYPIQPSVLTSGAQYKGFQTRPKASAGTFNVADAAHPSTGDCSVCHGSTTAFSAIDKPANHIPYAAAAKCESCHTSSDFSVIPSMTSIHANAESTSVNCAQCHGTAAASFAIPAAKFSIVGLPGNHVPTASSCEVCHVGAGSSVAATPVVNGAKFSGSKFSHSGITSNCAACHGPTVTGSTFVGVSKIVVMPRTSPMGEGSHIPSSTTCETCHLGSTPAGQMAAVATATVPGSAFATPAPTTTQIHAGVTGGCSSCHESGYVWMGVSSYPISPTGLTSGAQYTGFQTRPRASAGVYNVADVAHPSTGDCSQCHTGTAYFQATEKPANHIPYAATAQCSNCHTSTDFSAIPSVTNIHAFAPSTATNCTQCHGAAAASFAIPAANFSIVGLPGNHLPTTASCEVCHVGAGSSIAATPVVNGAKFSGSKFSHSGIGNNCAACHGPTITGSSFIGVSQIVVMPPVSPVGSSSHIPSSTTCETCHAGSTPGGLIAASASKTAPGTLFQSPVPTTAQIHNGVTGSCSSCHDTGYQWMGVSSYPIAPKSLTAGAQYTGFQTRPTSTSGSYNVADPAHPLSGDCSQCHSSTNYFTGTDKPANHIPYSASAQCNSCHTSTDYAAIPSVTNIHAYAPSTSSNCAQCHGATAASFNIPAANFSIVGLPGNHIPTTSSCELCHVGAGSSIAATPVVDGAKFSGSKMSHAEISSNCAACHGPSITGASFVGVSKIIVMPATSPVGPTSHIPSTTTCETCHLGSKPAGQIPAVATSSTPGSAFATPVPNTAQIHSGVTTGCNACHAAAYEWMGMSNYPIQPKVLTTGAQYTGFQTLPRGTSGTYNIQNAAHPPTGDCSQCHSNTNYFVGPDKPANHIPYAAAANCADCHTSSDYSALPTLTNIHANAPSTSSNCAQCHGAAAASFAIPGANFSIVGIPDKHVPTTASCEVCHVGAGSSIAATPVLNGAKFSGSKFNHSGIGNNCVACHGPSINGSSFIGISQIVVMPATTPVGSSSHIPSSTTCETCHVGSTPSGLIAASSSKSAPGTLFQTPVPTTAQIHSGITSGCNSCHDAGYQWMGMTQADYQIAPKVLTTGAQYTGFQTRPTGTSGTYNVADAAHPSAGDCSQCHSGTNYFTAVDKPNNHIPYSASAQCSSCHTSTDYAALPSLTNIHAYAPNTATKCDQCHGAAAASFAIPAANFSIVGLPDKHVPTTASCEVCHVGAGSSMATTPVVNGAKFSGSKFSHTGITSNCVACHGGNITGSSFVGITQIVVLPPTTPQGTSSHIPTGAACEACHLGSTPSGLIAASSTKTAPGTLFQTPVPTTAQIHSGITGNCSSCHDTGYQWMGMTQSVYQISPKVLTSGAQYTGFQTRPTGTSGTYNVADVAHPSAGDCSQCHSGTNYFTAVDKPSNHIPYSATAQCSSCHTSTDYAALPTLTNIHAYAPSTSSNCAQCHGAAAASFAIPAANFSIVGLPDKHVPTTASCEVCHVGAGSSMATTPVVNGAKFSGSKFSHTGITSNCEACHGPSINSSSFVGISQIVAMPPTSPVGASAHIPSSTTCATCHLGSTPSGLIAASATKTAPGTLFQTPVPTTAQIHSGITSNCNSCHDTGYQWMGMTQSVYQISPKVLTSGAQYTGFQTRPTGTSGTYNVADAAHPSAGDCSQCHSGTNYFTAVDKPSNHIPYATNAQCSGCHTSTDYSVIPTLTNIHANAASTSTNCAQCHGPTAASYAIPAANFSVVGLPTNHVPTTASCEVCHVGTGSSIATTPVVNGAKFSGSKFSHTGITSNCVACHGPTITGSSFVGVSQIVVMPAVTPMGSSSHIPSSTTCEACHLATTPSGLIPASSTKAAPGSLFLTPAPTTTQIHSGITGNCNSCHEANYLWMSMSQYPISPTVLGNASTQYIGFNTRPTKTATTYSVADAGHPSTGDCSSCHTSTAYFSGVAKPTGHIPTTESCATCHSSTDYSIAGLASLTSLHTNIKTGCASCHTAGAGAGPFAGCTSSANCTSPPPITYQPKTMPLAAGGSPTSPSPSTHIPVGSAACEKCHTPDNYTTFALTAEFMKGNATAHGQVSGALCDSCHEYQYVWAVGIPKSSKNFQPSSTSHHGRKSGQDCTACHSKNNFTAFNNFARVRPVMRAGLNGAVPRALPDSLTLLSGDEASRAFNHQGVAPGQCQTCHNGQMATGLSVKHLPTKTSCDSCHRSTAWKPAQFNHQGVLPGQCQTCHEGHLATGKPAGHFVTARSCETCHRTIAWVPVNYSHMSPLYQSRPDKTSCVSCHVTNGEIFPRQLRGSVRPKPPVPGP